MNKSFGHLLFICLLGICLNSFAETSELAQATAVPQTNSQNANDLAKCQKDLLNQGCDPNSNDPDLKKCDSDESTQFQIKNAALNCPRMIGEAIQQFGHSAFRGFDIQKIAENTGEYKTQNFNFKRNAFLLECQKSSDCLGKLFHAAYRRSPTDKELVDYQNAWFGSLDFLWNRSMARDGIFSRNSDPWMQEKINEILTKSDNLARPREKGN